VVVSCLWLGGCNQLFGIERLKPVAGAPAANAGAGSAPEADEDAGL
jgi:hypothetical protein